MRDYILVLASVVLLAAYFVCNKVYQKREGADRETVFFFHGMLGLLTAAFAFALSGGRPSVTWFSLLMAALMNTFSVSYSLLGFQMMEAGKMASYTLFLMSGGMVVPYLVGIFALGEPATLARSLGLAAIIGGVLFANGMGERMDRRLWRHGILVFLLNGMVSVVSKLHQIADKMETVPTLSFVFLGGLCSFALCSIAWLACRERGKKRHIAILHALPILLTAAAVSGGSSFLQLLGAKNLPATVLYPMVTGGNIILTALAGHVVFQEKLTKRMAAGIFLCFLGTLLFL